MKTYTTTKKSEISNRVCEELNASVLSATFNSKEGVQLADLYTSKNSSSMLVSHGTCAPTGSEFIETVNIIF